MPELILIFIALAPLILSVFALISCLKSNFQEPNNKIVWVVVILFLPVIGSILYFVISPKQRIK